MTIVNEKENKKTMDELMKVCHETTEHNHKMIEGMETICKYLNQLLDAMPDYIYNANDDRIRIQGFYVDEFGRFRYETID